MLAHFNLRHTECLTNLSELHDVNTQCKQMTTELLPFSICQRDNLLQDSVNFVDHFEKANTCPSE